MGQRAARTVLVALAGLASLAMVPGCSGTSSSPTSTTSPASPTPSSGTNTPTPHGAFGECLRQHGVSIAPSGPADPRTSPEGPPPGPPPVAAPHGSTPPPPGVDQGTWDNAMQACESLAPAPPPPIG
jgi:hypothetical protein